MQIEDRHGLLEAMTYFCSSFPFFKRIKPRLIGVFFFFSFQVEVLQSSPLVVNGL